MSPARVIGVGGTLPWHYPADLRRFKERTLGTTIIMGRLTWESIGRKQLPKRRNVVITGTQLPHVETFPSIDEALVHCDGPVWFIGGATLYESALSYCDLVDVTHVPDQVLSRGAVYFPELNSAEWRPGPLNPMAEDHRLKQQCYFRRVP